MAVLVSYDCKLAVLRRYEIGGARPIKTHQVELVPEMGVPPCVIENFRLRPAERDRIGHIAYPNLVA